MNINAFFELKYWAGNHMEKSGVKYIHCFNRAIECDIEIVMLSQMSYRTLQLRKIKCQIKSMGLQSMEIRGSSAACMTVMPLKVVCQ
ncbi:hypothetical protein [Janthinobacterium agaricidamnosum]|uniref:Uncharacterized protein n=1 Tax=Janthinobacterium agaricidamnosum NBRC 102515 = DSM 9628 TaxID=1349767 RepID=W0V208_9BURK|nr:hypothetical protein [Janthinobacterium agaricidamnosum]CDG81650.1 hypothetical protein GJA_995 [Janthinobacterium agaricidamnosum NBRC 102515 = DSM 9628]